MYNQVSSIRKYLISLKSRSSIADLFSGLLLCAHLFLEQNFFKTDCKAPQIYLLW